MRHTRRVHGHLLRRVLEHTAERVLQHPKPAVHLHLPRGTNRENEGVETDQLASHLQVDDPAAPEEENEQKMIPRRYISHHSYTPRPAIPCATLHLQQSHPPPCTQSSTRRSSHFHASITTVQFATDCAGSVLERPFCSS